MNVHVKQGKGKTDPTPIHLHTQTQHSPLQLLSQDPPLLIRAILEELLNDIVAIDISHQRNGVRSDLVKDRLARSVIRRFDEVLDQSRAGLVPRELDDVASDIL